MKILVGLRFECGLYLELGKKKLCPNIFMLRPPQTRHLSATTRYRQLKHVVCEIGKVR